jgi:hypothetical protein
MSMGSTRKGLGRRWRRRRVGCLRFRLNHPGYLFVWGFGSNPTRKLILIRHINPHRDQPTGVMREYRLVD